jgi:hypothetical protein
MDTRRFRRPAPSDAVAAFRWLGWVMLMMFVLVQNAHAERSGTTTKARASGPQARELSVSPGAVLADATLQIPLKDPLGISGEKDTQLPPSHRKSSIT